MHQYTAFPSIDMKRTGKAIEQARKARGISVRELQDYFGFEYPQAIYKWQWGETLPSVDNLFALAKILGVNMEDLLVACDREVQPFSAQKNAPGDGLPEAFFHVCSRRTVTNSPSVLAMAAMLLA